ncbi:hypothetical protein IL992_30430 [Microbispora sp. NEAU-D428]|uniref:hypothetical protein n=1 Tax=Microbispora sitophila TaxID=2771537 RepID=UPI00186831FE|nr:hypothetical protein [Microbispora sitophila]MBE3013465.1 hypothetical protein [Microbispora sitophila]
MSLPSLTVEEFDEYLDSIRQHYLVRAEALRDGRALPNQQVGRFILPSELTLTRDALRDQLPQPLKDVLKNYAEEPTVRDMKTYGEEISAWASAAHDGEMSSDEYGRRLDGLADAIITRSFTETQIDLTTNLRTIAYQHPDWQQLIINISNEEFQYLGETWKKVHDFIVNTVKSYNDWVGKIIEWFAAAIRDVENRFAKMGI